jgi:hypothetical protein
MEKDKSEPLRLQLNSIIDSQVRIVLAVQLAPFVYTLLFLVVFSLAFFSTNAAMLTAIDYVCFISPLVVLAHLVYSWMLRFCVWHRLACALPILPQPVDLYDTYISPFTVEQIIIVKATIIVTILLYFLFAYGTFFSRNGRNYNRCIRVLHREIKER